MRTFTIIGGAPVVAALLLVACGSSLPPPSDRLSSAEAAARSARELGADKEPKAQLHLKLATEQIDQAKKLMADGDNKRADLDPAARELRRRALRHAREGEHRRGGSRQGAGQGQEHQGWKVSSRMSARHSRRFSFRSRSSPLAVREHLPPKELVDARAAYQSASKGPAAQQSPAELHVAKQSLDQAERSFNDDGDTPQTKDYAYIAIRKSQLAEALGPRC